MRPYVIRNEAFGSIIHLHTGVMVEEIRSIYDMLEHNSRLQQEFLFLMQLSVHIPELQKHEYFLYIRNFIIEFERQMRSEYISMNHSIHDWNVFIVCKNYTGIGYFLPGKVRPEIV